MTEDIGNESQSAPTEDAAISLAGGNNDLETDEAIEETVPSTERPEEVYRINIKEDDATIERFYPKPFQK